MSVCPQGHTTPAENSFCSVCGSPVSQGLPPVVDDPSAAPKLVITGDDLSPQAPAAQRSGSTLPAKNPDVVEARRRLIEEGYVDAKTGEATHGAPKAPEPARPLPGIPAQAAAQPRPTASRPTGPRYVGDANLGGIKLRQGIDCLAYVIAGIAMIVFGVSEDGSGWGVALGIAAILYGGWILIAESYWVSTFIYLIAILAVVAAFSAASGST